MMMFAERLCAIAMMMACATAEIKQGANESVGSDTLLSMTKVGGFAGEDGSKAFEVVAVKPETNVRLDSLHSSYVAKVVTGGVRGA